MKIKTKKKKERRTTTKALGATKERLYFPRMNKRRCSEKFPGKHSCGIFQTMGNRKSFFFSNWYLGSNGIKVSAMLKLYIHTP